MTTLVEQRPAPGQRAPWSFPTVTRTFADGATVVAAHLPGQAMVTLKVVVDAGAVTDPPGLEGIAQATTTSLTKGARGLDEEGLAIAFETVGATPSGGATFDNASFGLSAPTGLIGDAAELVADVVRRPTLDTGEIERVVAVTLDGLIANESDPAFVAGRAARAHFHAPESRFSAGAQGTRDSLAAIDADAVRAFHAQRWASAPLTVVVAGDLAGVDLDAIASAFKAGVTEVDRGATVPTINGGGRRVVLAHLPGSVQSFITLTAPGPRYDIPDAPELNVAQAVVLATFSARMNQRLREDLGYTYGSRGAVNRMRDAGTLGVSAQVRNDVTAASVKEAVAVLEASLGDQPLTDAEVEQARENLVSKFAVQYDGAGAVASTIANRVVHDLDDDERDVMLARLRTVTTDQANAAWNKYVDLDELIITIAGDTGAIRGSLEALGLPIVEE